MSKLLPIGQRVTHFDGGPSTHGKGTIVGYNQRLTMEYVSSNLGDAVAAVGAVESPTREQMLSAIAGSFYDSTRCPYLVQWDPYVPREDDSAIKREIGLAYPQGYRDVYEPDSIQAINE